MSKVDYDKEVMKQRRANIKEVIKNLNTLDMQEKIINYAQRHDLNKRYVEQKILDDPYFAMQFAKDPLKQSIHEKIASKHISRLEMVSHFKSLPSGGKNALYVGPSGISKGRNLGRAKSIDFEIHVDDFIVYATHKYTGAEGGAQDNQFNDVKQFISEVVHMTQADLIADNTFFIAILDGPYYLRFDRIDVLESLAVGCVEILNINQVEDYLSRLSDSKSPKQKHS